MSIETKDFEPSDSCPCMLCQQARALRAAHARIEAAKKCYRELRDERDRLKAALDHARLFGELAIDFVCPDPGRCYCFGVRPSEDPRCPDSSASSST